MRRLLAFLVVVLAALAAVVYHYFGGGERFPDRSLEPTLDFSAVETVARLPLPPGNVAVSRTGRVFFTFHPEGGPEVQLAELDREGNPVPYPNEAFQKKRSDGPYFQSLLSIRIDRQDRLWALDHANYAFGQPRLLAFDLAKDELVHAYDFPADAAPLLSMLNDFQVHPAGRKIYIADTSLFGRRPALVVYDVEEKRARRLLEGHESVLPKRWIMNAAGRDMVFFGIFTLTIGVDSIALDQDGEWLYFAPVSDHRLYRIRTEVLDDESLSSEAVAAQVEVFSYKTMSDGLSMDVAGGIYVTDMEHSAIHRIGPDRKLVTLLEDPRLRWPDGLSFGPDGWLYVTCSALHQVILRSAAHVQENAPYPIYRFRPGPAGIPGH